MTLGTLGNVSCTASNNAVPGTYAAIESYGSVQNNTYLQALDGAGDYYTAAFTAPQSTSAPTTAPQVVASVPPTTPGAALAIVYYGEYTLPTTPGLTTAATNGCFILDTAATAQSQALSSGVSLGRRAVVDTVPAPSPSPFGAYGYGLPAFSPPYPNQSAEIVTGVITGFAISNVTRTSGSGSFVLSTPAIGNTLTATGTAVITGSTAFYTTENLQSSVLKRRTLHLRRR